MPRFNACQPALIRLDTILMELLIMVDEYDEVRTRVLTDNTAQGVLNHLKALDSNRSHVRARWIWELLQNARDASNKSDLVAYVELGDGEIVFRHNGASFKREEIAHLIYHGSTKVDSEGTIGQYGSGFLTTHLLSPEINISGRLDNGKYFEFLLKREVGSVSELSESMERAWDDFKSSVGMLTQITGDLTTRFLYPLEDQTFEAAEEGIAALKLCAPLVVAFNQEFSIIEIQSSRDHTSFKVTDRVPLGSDGIQEVTVAEVHNGNAKERRYLLAIGHKATVAIPFASVGNSSVCLPLGNIPRLYLGFPLIGTENFSFPGAINSLNFTPTENRDGVYLGRSTNDANLENEAVIEEGCELLIRLLRFMASRSWGNVYALTDIPAVREQDWVDPNWLRKCAQGRLVDQFRQTPIVIGKTGEPVHPEELGIPVAESTERVGALWNLLDDWNGKGIVLPRQSEAAGWSWALKSWAEVEQSDVSSFSEAIDGRRLAKNVHETSYDPRQETTTHRISSLKFEDTGCAIDWLDRLNEYLRVGGQQQIAREYRIVPSQREFLRVLPMLQRDCDIPEELKEVAELLNWQIRGELRDKRVNSLRDDEGRGDWDRDYVVGELIRRLNESSRDDLNERITEGCVRLFAWIVDEKIWNLLSGFPAFTDLNDSHETTIIYLPRNTQDTEQPLAPIGVWSTDLRRFSDLFPSTKILSDRFFKAVPTPGAWHDLDRRSLVRTGLLVNGQAHFERFFPDHPLRDGVDHRTVGPVMSTDIVTRTEIMNRVRDSQARARLFWRFLIEWMAKNDIPGLSVEQAVCECGETHRYYPATWIAPLRETNWVRLANDRRAHATASSLASLLRDSDWTPRTLNDNPAAVKLLQAIGVSRFDLMREFVAADEAVRSAVDNALVEMLTTAGGDVQYLDHAREYLEDLKNDDGLPDLLADRRKRRTIVNANQRLGQRVEDLVQESLEGKGFIVRRTHVGSDFEIEFNSAEMGDVGRLELKKSGQSWLVEVKATRENDVRMSVRQARTATERKSGFLLCVVPVEVASDELDLENVGTSMRFVENIGSRMEKLCDNVDELDGVRDRIAGEGPPGIQLEVISGTARVRVHRSVWQHEGFPLEDLPVRLR